MLEKLKTNKRKTKRKQEEPQAMSFMSIRFLLLGAEAGVGLILCTLLTHKSTE